MEMILIMIIDLLTLFLMMICLYVAFEGTKKLEQYIEFRHGVWPTIVLLCLYIWICDCVLGYLNY